MDETSNKSDEEFQNYLQIIRPHMKHIDNPIILGNCNKWIQKLSEYKASKSLRNKYTFLMSYQLSRDFIDEPFLDEPPAELEDFTMEDCSDSSASASAGETPRKSKELRSNREIKLTRDTNIWTNPILNHSSDTECYESISNAVDSPQDVVTQVVHEDSRCKHLHCAGDGGGEMGPGAVSSVETPAFGGSENVTVMEDVGKDSDERFPSDITKRSTTVTFTDYSPRRKTPEVRGPRLQSTKLKLPAIKSLSNHEERLKNLIMRLREMKRHQRDNKDSILKISPLASERGVQISCADMATMEMSILRRKYKLLLTSRNQMNRRLKAAEQRNWILDELRVNHEKEIVKLRAAGQEKTAEVQKVHEAIAALKDELSKRLKDHLYKTSCVTAEMEALHHTQLQEKNKVIANLEVEIKRLEMQMKNGKQQVFQSDKSVSTDEMGTLVYIAKLERRVEKLTKSKLKLAKVYAAKINFMEQEKQIMTANLQLQMFRKGVHVSPDSNAVTQQEFTKTMEELEKKYMRMIALIQATAIKTRIQDQQNLETILRAMRGLKAESSSSKKSDNGECSSFPSTSNDNPKTPLDDHQLKPTHRHANEYGLPNHILDYLHPNYVECCRFNNNSGSNELPQREF